MSARGTNLCTSSGTGFVIADENLRVLESSLANSTVRSQEEDLAWSYLKLKVQWAKLSDKIDHERFKNFIAIVKAATNEATAPSMCRVLVLSIIGTHIMLSIRDYQ